MGGLKKFKEMMMTPVETYTIEFNTTIRLSKEDLVKKLNSIANAHPSQLIQKDLTLTKKISCLAQYCCCCCSNNQVDSLEDYTVAALSMELLGQKIVASNDDIIKRTYLKAKQKFDAMRPTGFDETALREALEKNKKESSSTPPSGVMLPSAVPSG